MQQPTDQELGDTGSYCCPTMTNQIDQVCAAHPDLIDCPDALVTIDRSGRYRFPIRDGGSSSVAATFCPWCGTRLVNETNTQNAKRWRDQAAVLAEIGLAIYEKNISVDVELPPELVALAVEAWEVEESDDGIADFETEPERTERHRAGSLALIGLTVADQDESCEDFVALKLDPWLIGHALDAADDAGLIVGPPKGDGSKDR